MTTLVRRGAYADALATTRREPGLEKQLAEVVLEEAARSPDPVARKRAFGELQLAGTRSRPVLSRLTDSQTPETRARALAALLSLGDDSARGPLADLADSPDPELSAIGYGALDPDGDRERLIAALTLPNQARRLAAVRVLARASESPEVRAALEPVLAHDPDASVRAGAATALAKQGREAATALQRALDDEAQPVRLAAISGLGALIATECEDEDDCLEAPELARLGRDLGAAPTPESLAAAAAFLRASPPREVHRAIDVFSRALVSGDPALRGRAATTCRGLRELACEPWVLRDRVRREPNPEVKLLIALAIGPADPLAREALASLAHEQRTLISIEAAAELAASGDASYQRTLAKALDHPDARVRVSALRAVARLSSGGALEGQSDPTLGARVAGQLADRDERVRTAAAVAMLAAG